MTVTKSLEAFHKRVAFIQEYNCTPEAYAKLIKAREEAIGKEASDAITAEYEAKKKAEQEKQNKKRKFRKRKK